MRYVFAFFALLMVLAVAVQYNDPDGPLWMLYYGVAAVWACLAAFRPHIPAAGMGRGLLGATLVAAVALTIFYWPPAEGWWHQEVWWESEESREGMGMMIVTVVLVAVLAASFARRRSAVEASR